MEDQKRLLSLLLEAARIYCANISDIQQRLSRIEQSVASIIESLKASRPGQATPCHMQSHSVDTNTELPLVEAGDAGRAYSLLIAAMDLFMENNLASVSLVQRRFRVGYAKAARTVDELERLGLIGPFVGSKARVLLVDAEEWREVRQSMVKSVSESTSGALPSPSPR